MTSFRNSLTHIQKLPSAFWVVIAATLTNQVGNMAMVFLVVYLKIHLHFTLPRASFVYASCCAALLVSGSIAGALADRFGPARVMTIALFSNAAVLLCIPFVKHFWLVELTCIVWGAIFGTYKPAAQTFLTHISPHESYKITFSIYRLAWNLGMSIGPAIGGYMASHSFQTIFYFNGGANIFAGIFLVIGLRKFSGIQHAAPEITASRLVSGFKNLKYDKALRILALGLIPICMVFYQNASTLAVFIQEDLKFPLTFYGLLFTVNTLMIVFFELPINIATLTWPARRSMLVGSFFISLGFSGFLLASTEWHVIFLVILFSLGEMILFPTASSYVAENAPIQQRGNYMSVYTTSVNIGLLLGPWAGAMVMHHFTSVGLWITCGIWGLASILIFIYLPDSKYDKLAR